MSGRGNRVIDSDLGVEATFVYHGPNYHMDVKVEPLGDEQKNIVAFTKNR